MQNFMLERLLERISVSEYKAHFILKGGFLIAAMVGLDTRATMDMDATIKGLPVNEDTVKDMFLNLCEIDLHDDVKFEFRSIGEIREGDEYTGYRVALSANFPPMYVPLNHQTRLTIIPKRRSILMRSMRKFSGKKKQKEIRSWGITPMITPMMKCVELTRKFCCFV